MSDAVTSWAPADALAWGQEVPAALVRWSRTAAPREACGLLLGARARDALRVRLAVRARNVASSADAFALAPGDILAAHDLARATATRVIASWHSHVFAAATPSARDFAGAWPDLCCAILGPLAYGTPVLRVFALAAGSQNAHALACRFETRGAPPEVRR